MNENEKYIEMCFELASQAKGFTSPNPLVGCVIVKNGKIIGSGYHKKYGEAHAEKEAINNAIESVEGATLFCNLEPCSHLNKQTPPCVPLIIKSGIKKVVISNRDPNPFVNGKGIAELKSNGIEVVENILSEKGLEFNKFYFKSVTQKLPYITLKIALSKDGFINKLGKVRTKITGEQADLYVHQLRSEYDAVLVGANTINIDNPQLNVRYVKGKNPKRIVLDGNLSSNLDSIIFNDEQKSNTMVFCSDKLSNEKTEKFLNNDIHLIQVKPNYNNQLEILSVLEILTKEKITSLFVEGGAKIFDQFIKENLFDEIIIIRSKENFGNGIMPENLNIISKLKKYSWLNLGVDELEIYKKY
ncbi:MAG: bifunctional diaminohydroxyphosphoribosylaminopyrimidine deaminase/5-amino-6-(5-phosphoribosylamino)uracil reductase RibD [Ignavibacteriales bacterium]|nr:bifunctional diaminohydroxyphosphoribosylaminopyrimidine deaminase/5-amino-6-(5-phosphoribosylamino)uracil reductase RibD [Ignavibacteriales bacterium]